MPNGLSRFGPEGEWLVSVVDSTGHEATEEGSAWAAEACAAWRARWLAAGCWAQESSGPQAQHGGASTAAVCLSQGAAARDASVVRGVAGVSTAEGAAVDSAVPAARAQAGVRHQPVLGAEQPSAPHHRSTRPGGAVEGHAGAEDSAGQASQSAVRRPTRRRVLRSLPRCAASLTQTGSQRALVRSQQPSPAPRPGWQGPAARLRRSILLRAAFRGVAGPHVELGGARRRGGDDRTENVASPAWLEAPRSPRPQRGTRPDLRFAPPTISRFFLRRTARHRPDQPNHRHPAPPEWIKRSTLQNPR
jgi:hypothetical protein